MDVHSCRLTTDRYNVYLSAMKQVFGKDMEHTLMTKGEQGPIKPYVELQNLTMRIEQRRSRMHRFDPDRYYRTTDPELAVLATRGTLSQWRHRGEGPPYIRYGNRVLYEGRALNEWLDAHVVHPTNPRVRVD